MGTTKNSWRLVVDTDVVQSASETEAPRSKNCRITLITIQKEGHSVVITNDISEEWRRHNSRYGRTWLVSMYARKRVFRVNTTPSEELRLAISDSNEIDSKRQAMAKDVHLLEAAMATDQKVLSLDDTVRKLFSKLCHQYSPIRVVFWLNPDTQNERVVEWLKLVPEYDQDYCLVHWTDEAQ